MTYDSLSHWMKLKNDPYYKSSSTALHSDFDTYAQSPHGLLTRANAQAFHAYALEHPQSKWEVLEVGVGVGAFASGFLQELVKLDKEEASDISSVLKYTLADFSDPMLERASATLAKTKTTASVQSMQLDASNLPALKSRLSGRAFDLIRINELFSDLPTDVFVYGKDGPQHVLFNEKMDTRMEPIAPGQLLDWEIQLLTKLPEERFIPINTRAAAAMSQFAAHLTPGGWVDIFDYGFYFEDDFVLPAPIWNPTLVREFGGQWTVDLNFIHAALSLRQAGYKPFVGRQQEYVESVVGEVEATDTLDYVPKKTGSQKNAKKTKKPSKSTQSDLGEREDDFFYHLQIQDV